MDTAKALEAKIVRKEGDNMNNKTEQIIRLIKIGIDPNPYSEALTKLLDEYDKEKKHSYEQGAIIFNTQTELEAYKAQIKTLIETDVSNKIEIETVKETVEQLKEEMEELR